MHSPFTMPATDAIPDELKSRFQWVCWRYEERGGKRTKVPYNPRHSGRCASVSDSQTWSNLALALDEMRQARMDGIGFVFSERDPFTGIDLDDCMEEDGTIQPWAREILDKIPSYTEITPSGRGLHIIARGRLPEAGRRSGRIELYDKRRYFTVTGAHLAGTPEAVQECQSALEALYEELGSRPEIAPVAPPSAKVNLEDRELLERAFAARNGAAFRALWQGDTSAFPSASEADLALCSHLAFWTGGDGARVDALFRQSGLFRADKWDSVHCGNGKRYGEATIARAIATTTEHFRPRAEAPPGMDRAAPSGRVEEAVPAPSPCPPLPSDAEEIYQHLTPDAGAWLDDYIDYASRAAPMTPRSFHEAAGLFAASTVVARRLRLEVADTEIYPNLFLLFMAHSTLYSKTTGLKVLMRLFQRAEMDHFLLPQSMTPEAMTLELSLALPQTLPYSDDASREQWLRERAIAAKRGWAIDEASGLFDSLKRDYNTGLLGLILKLYDCPDSMSEQTVGRGRVTVSEAYMSFFGVATPAAMEEHMSNRTLWTNGLWARFALITPDSEPVFRFFPTHRLAFPASLVQGLQRLARLFPMPSASIVDFESAEGGKRKSIVIRGEEPPSSALLAKDVWEAWERYTRATRFDHLKSPEVAPEFYGSYGRLAPLAIKIAMLLAALDSESLPVRVELPHYARAQQIVERWRATLHTLRVAPPQQEVAREQVKVRILALLDEAGDAGLTTRDIYKTLRLEAATARAALFGLAEGGLVEEFAGTNPQKRQLQKWRRVALQD